MRTKPDNILIITGEPSGDLRASEIFPGLKKTFPDTVFWGIGGDNLKSQGFVLTEHIKNLSLSGFVEVIKNLGKIKDQYDKLISEIEKRKPDAAILVDYPGFNLKVARHLKKKGIPVIYYILPQVWAWGASRIKKIKQFTDKRIVLFDFEKEFLKKYDVTSGFCGHPIKDSFIPDTNKTYNSKEPTIALLPGSRISEVTSLLPLLLTSISKLKTKTHKTINVLVAESGNIPEDIYENIFKDHSGINISREKDATKDILTRSDYAIVAAGTATLETAVMEVPFIVVYTVPFLTEILANIVLKIPYLSLPNIIAGKEIAPELYQSNVTPEKIAGILHSMIEDEEKTLQVISELKAMKRSLGDTGAAERAVKIISDFIISRK